MKSKIILSAVLGFGAISLSNVASAAWVDGPCVPDPYTGPPPCIEAWIGDDIYHFNGDASHADDWHGLPPGPATGDLIFTGPSDLDCGDLGADCTLTLRGQVKKCQDSNGDWRLGIKVNSSSVGGGGLCSVIGLSGFPWFAGSTDAPHCPFEDDCDNFVLYDPNATSYFATVGNINISLLGFPRVTNGHVHNVEFTPGCAPSFNFNSDFYNCSEASQNCSVDGLLTATNVDCLFVR